MPRFQSFIAAAYELRIAETRLATAQLTYDQRRLELESARTANEEAVRGVFCRKRKADLAKGVADGLHALVRAELECEALRDTEHFHFLNLAVRDVSRRRESAAELVLASDAERMIQIWPLNELNRVEAEFRQSENELREARSEWIFWRDTTDRLRRVAHGISQYGVGKTAEELTAPSQANG